MVERQQIKETVHTEKIAAVMLKPNMWYGALNIYDSQGKTLQNQLWFDFDDYIFFSL